ncbi:YheC/YheD family protein [Paenibacillus endoradicis]|uniref:YheC/YheD family protein n=1 Tax=Paenibacillus endoradicis TaxID=2972487 RepID=UPI0021592902|nr:YheC/YheD family protein [Paenibacillus endoradicis]MCR8659977.1 YheC/YheD family protein [Paenibacillus endoradicis]
MFNFHWGRQMRITAKRRGRKADKMIKTRILLSNSYIRSHIPVTKTYSHSTLKLMLLKYGMVYIKPKNGSLGRGVIRVTRKNGRYISHSGMTISSYATFEGLSHALSRQIKGEIYIVQKGIHSLRHQGRLFDFRVVVQRSPNGGFEVTGIAGRISQRGRVVSNGGGGGAVGTIDSLLSPRQLSIVIPKIEKLSLAVMHQVRKHFRGQNEIGIDIAIDQHLRPWIVEFNTHPDHRMFVIMRDRVVLARIIHYGARYGKRYRLNLY